MKIKRYNISIYKKSVKSTKFKEWPISTPDLQNKCFCKVFHDYFWSGAAMYVLHCLNTVVAIIQMFFTESMFIFFMTFLKKMWRLSAHCHSRVNQPILKILLIYRKISLGKQLSQALYVFKLLHAPKFQIFSTKLVKVVKMFSFTPAG